jgi:ATP-dependent RNA helicase RhlE
MTFKDLGLCSAIIQNLEEKGYNHPTEIQVQVIPHILHRKDVVASAATGTGKTAAFCLPILERLSNGKRTGIRALILSPTRELASQVFENLTSYGKNMALRTAVIYGGVSQFHQEKEIRKGIDILVATPGRLQDLMDQGIISLKDLEIFVLDEADRMLDIGFIHDIHKLLRFIPKTRQTIFLSATMPREVQDLIGKISKDPIRISVESRENKTPISQSIYYVPRENKRALLRHVIAEHAMRNVIVFTRTKHGADKIAKDLNKYGVSAEAFHGDKTQFARQRTLSNFKRNATRVLVATDIAARGIDIAQLPFVINFELPESAETYTHRIGRTGRAGLTGSALSFCDRDERGQLKNINRIHERSMTVVEHPFA